MSSIRLPVWRLTLNVIGTIGLGRILEDILDIVILGEWTRKLFIEDIWRKPGFGIWHFGPSEAYPALVIHSE